MLSLVRKNRPYVHLGEFGMPMPFSNWKCSVFGIIRDVFFSRSPAKIFMPIVMLVAVRMPSFLIFIRWAMPRLTDRSMHVNSSFNSIDRQPNREVSTTLFKRLENSFSDKPLTFRTVMRVSLKSLNSPNGANFMSVFRPRERFPSFHEETLSYAAGQLHWSEFP